MTIWKATLLAVLIAASSPALVAPASAAGNPFLPGGGHGASNQGTPKEQAACPPDVRRFCSSLKPDSGSGAFLSCLQANRAKLSKACNEVLVSHGQ